MADEIDKLAEWLGNSRLEDSGSGGSGTITRFGSAVADSAGGTVYVTMNDNSDGTDSVAMPTAVDVREGESVIVTAVGGQVKTPMVTGVVEDDTKTFRGKVLFELMEVPSSGRQGTITLNDNADNYDHIVVMFATRYGSQRGSTTIDKSYASYKRTNTFLYNTFSLTVPTVFYNSGDTVPRFAVFSRELKFSKHSSTNEIVYISTAYDSSNNKYDEGGFTISNGSTPITYDANYIFITKVIGYY